ncbi:HdeD family acid-resistance protein [Oligoflexus tunisiensis]|uniref:HdeD family acid-resistance protein n=1 Tax=Oligoflexus tunisiensis TaxID=708132 RepID=UPI00114CA5B4|nr:HdeD family acid-resistance protein [Oligoflexus tunisiensis]
METQIGRSWTLWLVRGIVALLFGLVALISPFATLTSLVMVAAAFMVVDGIFAFFSLFSRRDSPFFWTSFFEALVGVALGVLLLMWPGVALLTFLYVLAAWAVVTGVFEIVSAVRLRKVIEREWALGLAGLASIVFGVAVLVFPGLGMVATSWMLGGYAIIFGVLMMNIAINVRRVQHKFGGGMGTPKAV